MFRPLEFSSKNNTRLGFPISLRCHLTGSLARSLWSQAFLVSALDLRKHRAVSCVALRSWPLTEPRAYLSVISTPPGIRGASTTVPLQSSTKSIMCCPCRYSSPAIKAADRARMAQMHISKQLHLALLVTSLESTDRHLPAVPKFATAVSINGTLETHIYWPRYGSIQLETARPLLGPFNNSLSTRRQTLSPARGISSSPARNHFL